MYFSIIAKVYVYFPTKYVTLTIIHINYSTSMTEHLPEDNSLETTDDNLKSLQTSSENENKATEGTQDLPVEETPPQVEPPVQAEPKQPIFHAPWFLSFHGEGTQYFVIRLINAILQVVTFNFYYPWAKAAKLNYLYEQTEFAGSRFKFHGTGREMFIGYLKLLLILIVIYGGFWWARGDNRFILGFLLLYGGLILVYPLAIHGTAKYRLSRTTWRGIFFGYRGQLGELFAKFFIGVLLTLFTFGIYLSWLEIDLRKYVTQNVRFGSAEFDFVGKGGDLFLIKLKYFAFMFAAFFVVMMMFGIFGVSMSSFINRDSLEKMSTPSFGFIIWLILTYFFVIAIIGALALMRQREIFQYYADNTYLYQNKQWHGVKLNMTFSDLFVLSITNMLLIVFTLGIATPFVEIRTLHFIMPRLAIDGSFDPDALTQTESNYRDATGEDLGDWLDIDLA